MILLKVWSVYSGVVYFPENEMPQFDITALDHTAKSTTLTSVINKHRIHSYAELTSSDNNVQDQKDVFVYTFRLEQA